MIVRFLTAIIIVVIFANPANASWLSEFGKNIQREWNNCWSGGCDVIWEVNKRFDNGIKSKSQSMAKGVRVVFEESMNTLFDQKIRPMLEDIDLIIKNNMDNADEIIINTFKGVDKIIEKTILQFENATEKNIHNIRDHIILNGI